MSITRCWWCGEDPLYVAYHDHEWGTPQRDERALFELLCLEGFQAGLSWITILRKREAFRAAFDGFHIATVAAYGDAEVARLVTDAGIVRHQGKIAATIANARAVEAMHEDGRTLTELVWRHAPPARASCLLTAAQVPAATPASMALAQALKQEGMRFVGPTTVYAFMQSAGLVNDHLAECFRSL